MPEQAEFVDGDDYTWTAEANPAPIANEFSDQTISGFRVSDASTWYGFNYTFPPVQANPQEKPKDCRTYSERIESRFVDLETALTVLVDEVRHLREDIARIKSGSSEL